MKKRRKKKFDLAAEVSLLTGQYWIMGQMGQNYDDKIRDEFIEKIRKEIK